MWIANASQIREIDRRAIEDFGIPSRVLMERAGTAVFEAAQEIAPEGGRITVFCGRGNNGGDGFVVARLATRAGYSVACMVAADDAEQLSKDAREQFESARSVGLEPIFRSDPLWERKMGCLCSRDLIVDALLGTGAKRAPAGAILEAIQAINRSGVPVVSVDVPSGIDTDTGEELGESVWALRTVTFGQPKRFLFQNIGVEHSGYWTVAEIGYPRELLDHPSEARLIDREWVANLLPERMRGSHKGDNGSVLIIAGSRRMRGAAVLSALGAIRSGAGLVTVAGVDEVCDAVASHLPEAMVLPLPERDGAIAPEASPLVLEAMQKCHATVFGPGLTQSPSVVEFLGQVWPRWQRRCVVDADALNAVSGGLDLPLSECILTPHPGEMGRLLGTGTAEVQADRFGAVRQAASRTGKTVILKGPFSLAAEPSQPIVVNPTGNSGMATGGMGDVLTGILATLLAQSLPDWIAASCGMFWHGYAANLCADEIGPFGYTASDVARKLPHARAQMVKG